MALLLSPALAAAVLALTCAVYVLRQLLFSALRRVPGPWYTLFTGAVLKWHELRAGRTRYIHRLHLRHGPVVRVGPNELAFASADAVREIYCSGGSGYDKTEFYNLFTVYGRRTMFSTLNKEDHARKKRILADRYANSNVMRQPSLSGIEERARNFTELCTASVGQSLDIYIALHSYAFDCVTHHLFHPFGASSLRSKQDEQVMREVAFDDSLQNRLLKHYSPALHAVVGRAVGLVAQPRSTPLADRFVLETSAKAEGSSAFTLLSRMHDKKAAELDLDLEQVDIAAECCDHMVAGIDTTGDALCFLMYQLSLPESLGLQRRLQAELRASHHHHHPVFPKDGETTTPFDKLPFLDAVVQEGLRCFPAIPMSLPRYVPAGGRTIDGYFVPAGTVVSCQAYSVHRVNRDVFPSPETFDPDRWLLQPDDGGDAAAAAAAARKRGHHMFAFSSGGRGCVGKHLALAEMKLLLRSVYSRFSTVPDPCMTPESMAMSDQLISSRPAGQRCLLRFIPLEDDHAQ